MVSPIRFKSPLSREMSTLILLGAALLPAQRAYPMHIMSARGIKYRFIKTSVKRKYSFTPSGSIKAPVAERSMGQEQDLTGATGGMVVRDKMEGMNVEPIVEGRRLR